MVDQVPGYYHAYADRTGRKGDMPNGLSHVEVDSRLQVRGDQSINKGELWTARSWWSKTKCGSGNN
jgi:hypothetical protein